MSEDEFEQKLPRMSEDEWGRNIWKRKQIRFFNVVFPFSNSCCINGNKIQGLTCSCTIGPWICVADITSGRVEQSSRKLQRVLTVFEVKKECGERRGQPCRIFPGIVHKPLPGGVEGTSLDKDKRYILKLIQASFWVETFSAPVCQMTKQRFFSVPSPQLFSSQDSWTHSYIVAFSG